MCTESELWCGLLQCSCYTEHGKYGLFWLYAETVQWMSNAGSVWYVVLWNFIAAEHDRYGLSFMCKTGVSKAEYLVHSIHMNRLVHQRLQPIQQDLAMSFRPFPLRIETHTVPLVSDFHSTLFFVRSTNRRSVTGWARLWNSSDNFASMFLRSDRQSCRSITVKPFLEQEQMLDRHTCRRLLTVAVMCLSSAAFNSTQVSR